MGNVESSPARNRVVSQVLQITAVVLIALCVAVLFWPEFGTARRAEERVRCQKQCDKIWVSIQEFIAKNGDLPRDRSGDFSVEPLDIDAKSLTCPSSRRPYQVFPSLVISQVDANKAVDEAVPIVFDPACSHGGQNNEEVGVPTLLLSNGRVVSWPCTEDAYRKWVDDYAAGRVTDTYFPPRSE